MADLVWTANKGAQEDLVFDAIGQTREILFGGQKGGGKSGAIPALALGHVNDNPTHSRVLILRETFGELDDLIDMMRDFCLAAGATWNEQKKVWTFPCGGKIRFGHLGDGCRPYWGREFSLIIIDELTRCIETERDYMMLLGSLRNSKGVPCQVIAMSNPGGKGHAWVKARFKDAAPPRTIIKDERTGLERVFIPAGLKDNEHNLGPEYRLNLEQLPEAERDAYLNGNWDAFEGRIFKLLPGIHIWTWAQFNQRNGLPEDNRAIPSEWLRYRTYDHGFARPGACYWYAVDHEGRAFIYRELYTVARDSRGGFVADDGAKLPPRDVAIAIRDMSQGEKYAANWTGPDLFNDVRQDQAGGVKIATHFEAEGIFFTAWRVGDGSRIAGKQALHQRLSFESGEDGSPLTWPGLVILDDAAPHLCRTLPALEYSKSQPEIWDKTSEDHCLTADTIVHTLSGAFPISQLVGTTGELVSFDGERPVTRAYHDCRKTQEDVPVFAVRFTDGREIKATANHPFLTADGDWVRVDNLKAGDMIRSLDLIQIAVSEATISEIAYLGRQDVYNLEVAGTHCFAVNGGLVVHNCADSVCGFVKMNPWAPRKPRNDSGYEALKRRAHKEGASWMAN